MVLVSKNFNIYQCVRFFCFYRIVAGQNMPPRVSVCLKDGLLRSFLGWTPIILIRYLCRAYQSYYVNLFLLYLKQCMYWFLTSFQFYVERKTGYRFRSLVSVERYLKDPGKRADKKPMLIEYHRPRSKGFSLPDGWIVEGKPRSNSSHIDKVHTSVGLVIFCLRVMVRPLMLFVCLFADLHWARNRE